MPCIHPAVSHPARTIYNTRLLLTSLCALILASCADPTPPGPNLSLPLRINSGGPTIGEPGDPNFWQSDEPFVKGGTPSKNAVNHDLSGVNNPAPPAVYEHARFGDHILRIDGLPGGRYLVRFHFSDRQRGAKRSMDFTINNRTVISNFNVNDSTGKRDKAIIVDTSRDLKPNKPLIIAARKDKGDDVFTSGVEIIPLPRLETAPASPAEIGARIREFTSAPARFTWLQGDDGVHYTNPDSMVTLMGLDTEDGQGERIILSKAGPYTNPLFTPDGQRLVYSNCRTDTIHVIDWNGENRQDLGPGRASDIWRDPDTEIVWVYTRSHGGESDDSIVRRQLNDPSIEEPVWSITRNGCNDLPWFQVSADGTRFTDAFPWPACGVGDLLSESWEKLVDGCWPSIAPDNSYRSFIFHGSHRSISFFDAYGTNRRKIAVANIPGQENAKVYHPRWSNHISFFTLTSPQTDPQSELYLAKFDPTWHRVTGFARITHNTRADLFGNAWIKPDSTPPPGAVLIGATSSANSEPPLPPPSGLAWQWTNAQSKNESPPLPGETNPTLATLELTGTARYGPHYQLLLEHSSARTPSETGPRLAQALHDAGAFTLEALVTPASLTQSGPILSLGQNIVLYQEKNQLFLRLPAESPILITELTSTTPFHVLFAHSFSPEIADSWESDPPLVIGSETWSGSLEHVAFFNRLLSPDEIDTKTTDLYDTLSLRLWIPTSIVNARLIESTPTPSLSNIAPYRRALVENVYEITDHVYGPEIPSKKIIAREWAILANTPLPNRPSVGDTVQLALQPLDSHPQLTPEHQTAAHSADPTLPTFFNIALPTK
ncbi:MAG: hypothetical protein AAGD22_02765 [Verrucomicrobiota bacterium]